MKDETQNMTDIEKRQQKAMLLLECQEAEENLAQLIEKAKRLSGALRDLATWGERMADPTRDFDVQREVNIGSGRPVHILQDERYREAMNFDELVKLGKEIQTAEATLRDLRSRKSSLGLK